MKTKLLSKSILLLVAVFGTALIISSCKSEGCMDSTARNVRDTNLSIESPKITTLLNPSFLFL